jgi:hypothetical protein
MQYKGLNGTIVVGAAAVEIHRPASLAANNNLRELLVVELTRITGAVLDEGEPGRGMSRLSIEFDDEVAPPPVRDVMRWDAGTVTFWPRETESFTRLHEWLLSVAATNRAREMQEAEQRPAGDADIPVLARDQVLPPEPVVLLRCETPEGWPALPEGWWPDVRWRPEAGAERPSGHQYWHVDGPPVAVEAARAEPILPVAWEQNGPPSREAHERWRLSTFHGRVDFLDDLEKTLIGFVWRQLHWTEDDRDTTLGLHVPPTHRTVEARQRAWSDAVGALVAARSWLLNSLAAGTYPSPALSAWMERYERVSQAYWDASRAVDDVLQSMRDKVLQAMTPEQRHRYWWGEDGRPARDVAGSGEAAWRSAELLAESALRQLGFAGANSTAAGADAGLDVVGPTVAAQVKYTSAPVGRPVLQQLQGAAGGRIAVFFSRAGFTRTAVEYSNSVGMALFEISLPSTIRPLNNPAREMAANLDE